MPKEHEEQPELRVGHQNVAEVEERMRRADDEENAKPPQVERDKPDPSHLGPEHLEGEPEAEEKRKQAPRLHLEEEPLPPIRELVEGRCGQPHLLIRASCAINSLITSTQLELYL